MTGKTMCTLTYAPMIIVNATKESPGQALKW